MTIRQAEKKSTFYHEGHLDVYEAAPSQTSNMSDARERRISRMVGARRHEWKSVALQGGCGLAGGLGEEVNKFKFPHLAPVTRQRWES